MPTQGWFKRHAITVLATIVEVGKPRNAAQSQTQPVTIDVQDPSGETVRLQGWLSTWDHGGFFQAGEMLRVRYSPEKRAFVDYCTMTVPKEEWLHDLNHPSGIQLNSGGSAAGSVQVINASGADPASVLEKLGRLREQGLMSEAQLRQAQQQLDGSALSSLPSEPTQTGESAEVLQKRLQNLEQLRASGVVDQEEYAKQRKRILDSL